MDFVVAIVKYFFIERLKCFRKVFLFKTSVFKHLGDKNMRKEELEELKKRLDELQGETLSFNR